MRAGLWEGLGAGLNIGDEDCRGREGARWMEEEEAEQALSVHLARDRALRGGMRETLYYTFKKNNVLFIKQILCVSSMLKASYVHLP